MTVAQGLRSTAGIRPAYYRATVPLEVGTVPRTGLPWRPYAYRGTGVDTLTPPELRALLDAEPDDGPPLSKGMDRYLLADVGHLSASQAAAALGVAERTICRYRAALRAVRGAA